MKKTLLSLGILHLLLWSSYCHSGGKLFATQLGVDNVASYRVGGPDAIAGIGDWVVGNGSLCAAVSDIHHETGFSPWGGVLIDLGHCGRANDQWPFQHLLPNLDKDRPLKPNKISAESTEHSAALTVVAEGGGIRLSSEYRLTLTEPDQLVATHRLVRIAEGEAVTMVGALFLHPHFALTPFSLSTIAPSYSKGFSYASFDRSDSREMIDAMIPADIHVLVGDDALVTQVSYGVYLEHAVLIDHSGERVALPRFQQTQNNYSMQGVLSRPPWLGGAGKLGLLEFMQSRLMDIKRGETLELRQRLIVGNRSDVASVTDHIYRGAELFGVVDSANTIIHIRDRDGVAVTSVKPQPDGRFAARLPIRVDQVELEVMAPSGGGERKTVDINAKRIDVAAISSGEPALVRLPHIGPARLIFKGINGTDDPDFYDNLLGYRVDDQPFKDIRQANYLSLTGRADDPDTVELPPGHYRVFASRGIEFSVTESQVVVLAGKTVELDIAPPVRELSGDGWLAADFHVHAAPSFDSSLPVGDRLRGFVAQGGDVLVASEHNRIFDYQLAINQLGLQQDVTVLTGIELTGMARRPTMPFSHGHINIFPVAAKPEQFSGGLLAHEGKRLRQLIDDSKNAYKDALFQLNHPRISNPVDPDLAYFDHLIAGEPYDESQPLSADVNRSLIEADPITGTRDIDFDLMEVANGENFEAYKIIRRDWFSLMKQGERIVGTANSDTHGNQQIIAIPQNYVLFDQEFSEADFVQTVKQGKLIGTTGPLLTVVAVANDHSSYTFGETVPHANFELQLTATAASWVPLERLTIYINGSIYHQQAIERGESVRLPINMQDDGSVFVEVTGVADSRYSAVAPGFTPFAFANPLYIDADKNGLWEPKVSR